MCARARRLKSGGCSASEVARKVHTTENMNSNTNNALQNIKSILDQAGDPSKFRKGLAQMHGLDPADIDALIATAGPSRDASAETIALERVHAESLVPRSQLPALERPVD